MRYGSTLSDTHATRDHPPQPGLGTGLEAVKCHRAQAPRAGSVTPPPSPHMETPSDRPQGLAMGWGFQLESLGH